MMTTTDKRVFSGIDWILDDIDAGWQEIVRVGKKYNWGGFPTQIELINTAQINEMQVSHGMPIQFPFWLNGRRIMEIEAETAKYGNHILELVVNTNPSICYIMDNNTLSQQLLVLAHAGIGHNHFFKNNYLFKEWTTPETIIDFLIYGRDFILNCEEQYGSRDVETTMTAANFLAAYSVDKYHHKYITTQMKDMQKKQRREHQDARLDVVLDTDRTKMVRGRLGIADASEKRALTNAHYSGSVLEFLESLPPHLSGLKDWQKEIFRIIRVREQYFYPQIQTKLMNEGFATFVESIILNDLYDDGIIDDSIMLEYCKDESSVMYQRQFSTQSGQQINPYGLGRKMFDEIKRVCENPTDEDREFLPGYAGTDWVTSINSIVANYRDESFIREFLTPKLIRDLRLFTIETQEKDDVYKITNIHKELDYTNIRDILAAQYAWSHYIPDINICLDRDGDGTARAVELLITDEFGNTLTKESVKMLGDWIALCQNLPVHIYTESSPGAYAVVYGETAS